MKTIIISTVVAIALIGGAFLVTKNQTGDGAFNNVSIVDGVQIIEVKAKSGYFPRKSIAQAGIPTVLKVSTSGTFDCSSVFRIPSMGILRYLPNTGTTAIDLGTPTSTTLTSTCGMGMYSFDIEFRS